MTHSFDRYTVYIYSGTTYDALIQLFRGTNFVANLYFYPAGTHLPPNTISPNDSLLIHYHSHRFHEILQFLELEGPLQATVNPENGIGTISTAGPEHVGEHELKF